MSRSFTLRPRGIGNTILALAGIGHGGTILRKTSAQFRDFWPHYPTQTGTLKSCGRLDLRRIRLEGFESPTYGSVEGLLYSTTTVSKYPDTTRHHEPEKAGTACTAHPPLEYSTPPETPLTGHHEPPRGSRRTSPYSSDSLARTGFLALGDVDDNLHGEVSRHILKSPD